MSDAGEHVVACFRDIRAPHAFVGDPRASDFFDIDSNGQPDLAQRRAIELLKTSLQHKLCCGSGSANPLRVEVDLVPTKDGKLPRGIRAIT